MTYSYYALTGWFHKLLILALCALQKAENLENGNIAHRYIMWPLKPNVINRQVYLEWFWSCQRSLVSRMKFTLLFWYEIDSAVWDLGLVCSMKYSNYTKSTLYTVIFKSTPETIKKFTSTLDTDPPFKGPISHGTMQLTRMYCYGK